LNTCPRCRMPSGRPMTLSKGHAFPSPARGGGQISEPRCGKASGLGHYGDVVGLTVGVGVGRSVGITEGTGVSVGRIPVCVGDGRAAEGRTFGLAETVAAGVAVARPAATAGDAGVGIGDGVTLALGCGVGVGPVASGARRWELHCNATRANATTMTARATVDTPSAVRNDVLSESHGAFLRMASVPPCEPSPAAPFYRWIDQQRR
jgi:hypothetical protein